MAGAAVELRDLVRQLRFAAILLFAFGTANLLGQVQISSTAAGGYWSSPSTWVGGVVPGNRSFVTVKGPVVIDRSVGTAGGGGIGNISLNAAGASLSVVPNLSVFILFGSTGNSDPLGVACGGSVGNPGTCANMFGITIRRGNLDLEGSPGHPVTISTADGRSPIYIRNQASQYGPANLTLKFVSINNLGTSANAGYSGIVNATYAINPLTVDVENCQFLNYYRLLQGGAASNINSSLRWVSNSSYGAGAGTYGSIYLSSGQYFASFVVTDNTDQSPLAGGYYIYSFNLGNRQDIERNAVSGSPAYRRGLYDSVGWISGAADVGNRTVRNNLCFNYMGSGGGSSCVYLVGSTLTDTSTVIDRNVSTGAYETVAIRPVSKNSSVLRITNNWLSEDYDVRKDQGVVFIGGSSPVITNNIIQLSGAISSPPVSIGFFSYDFASNIVFDNNTLVGKPSAGGNPTQAAYFGESGFPVYNARARSNIFVNWGYGVLDNNHSPSTTTYLVDTLVGSGVHHNLTNSCKIPYVYNQGAGFENSIVTAHPNAFSYGDMDGVDPWFADTTRTPATYDARVLGGTGTGADFFARLAARSGFGGLYTLGPNPIEDMRGWLFAGFAPANSALRGAGYQGADMGAVPVIP